MSVKHVELAADIRCQWQNNPPVYRLYVGDELFAERTWIWQDKYLEESINITAEPGSYEIRLETLDRQAHFELNNVRVLSGSAEVDDLTVRIKNENS